MFTSSLDKQSDMNVLEAIEKNDFHLSPADLLSTARERMEKHGFTALPVVEENMLSGLLFKNELTSFKKEKDSPAPLSLSEAGLSYNQVYLFEQQHIFDIIPIMDAHQSNVVPIIDEQHRYLGMISWSGLIRGINTLLDCERPGSMLVLEVGQRDNALSHIAHIVESTNAQILSSFTRQIPDSTRLEITLKISSSSLSSVISALLRHDYTIKTTYHSDLDRDDLNARFEHLMNYINM